MPAKDDQKNKQQPKKPMRQSDPAARELHDDDLKKVSGGLSSRNAMRTDTDPCISKL
jgi:hypothetical protein